MCKHWRQEDSFCVQKELTINPDELRDCSETCPDYTPIQKHEMVTCDSCLSEFPLNKASRVEVKGKEYLKCPNCGTVVGLKRDDERLNTGIT